MNAMMVIKRTEGEICPDDARHLFKNAIWWLQNDKKYKRKTLILTFNLKPSLDLSFWPALSFNNSLLTLYGVSTPGRGPSTRFFMNLMSFLDNFNFFGGFSQLFNSI